LKKLDEKIEENVRNIMGSVGSGSHNHSENIWFVWFKISYSGKKVGFDDCDRYMEM